SAPRPRARHPPVRPPPRSPRARPIARRAQRSTASACCPRSSPAPAPRTARRSRARPGIRWRPYDPRAWSRAAALLASSPRPCGRASASSSGVVSTTSPRKAVWMTRLVNLQDREEGFLRDLDRAHLLHAPFSFFLLLEELALPGNVAAVAFGGHVLAQRANRFARDHLGTDRGLDHDLEQLARDQLLKLLGDLPPPFVRLVAVNDDRKRVHRLHRAVSAMNVVFHVRDRADQVEVELPFEPLAHDLHVQQAEEPAAEPEAQGHRRLRLVVQRSIVELQLGERVPQLFELLGVG